MSGRIVILCAAAAFAVAGCAGQMMPPAPPGDVDKNSPGYVHGYSDGCAAVNTRARKQHSGTVKDDKLYATDPSYFFGWNEAFKACEDKITPSALPIPGNSIIL